MPNQFKLKPEELQELSVARKSFNAIIDYQLKTHPEKADYLPQKAPAVKELAKEIESQGDYEHTLASLRGLKGKTKVIKSQGGVTAIEYTFEQVDRNAARAEAIKQERASHYDLKKNPSMAKRANLEPSKPVQSRKLDEKQLSKYAKAKARQARTKYIKEQEKTYKENFIKALENEWGAIGESFAKILRKKAAGRLSVAILDNGFNIGDLYSADDIRTEAEELLYILKGTEIFTDKDVETILNDLDFIQQSLDNYKGEYWYLDDDFDSTK